MTKYGLNSRLKDFLGDPEVNAQAFGGSLDVVKYVDEGKTIDESLITPCDLASAFSGEPDTFTVGQAMAHMRAERHPGDSAGVRTRACEYLEEDARLYCTQTCIDAGDEEMMTKIWSEVRTMSDEEHELLRDALIPIVDHTHPDDMPQQITRTPRQAGIFRQRQAVRVAWAQSQREARMAAEAAERTSTVQDPTVQAILKAASGG